VNVVVSDAVVVGAVVVSVTTIDGTNAHVRNP
jgi:hypothetical protein